MSSEFATVASVPKSVICLLWTWNASRILKTTAHNLNSFSEFSSTMD
jgi:hypothetical protein